MKFEELKNNFLSMESSERISFVAAYYEQRDKDISMTTVSIKQKRTRKSSGRKGKTISVTTDQLALMKSLGLV